MYYSSHGKGMTKAVMMWQVCIRKKSRKEERERFIRKRKYESRMQIAKFRIRVKIRKEM